MPFAILGIRCLIKSCKRPTSLRYPKKLVSVVLASVVGADPRDQDPTRRLGALHLVTMIFLRLPWPRSFGFPLVVLSTQKLRLKALVYCAPNNDHCLISHSKDSYKPMVKPPLKMLKIRYNINLL